MKLSKSKNRFRRMLDALRDVIPGVSPSRGVLSPSVIADEARRQTKDLQKRLPENPARVVGLTVGGLAGLTAGSARISSLRRQSGEARSHR